MIITFVNQKGGVAKTTTVANVADGIAKTGKKVLAIDLDPQSNLTKHLGVSLTDEDATIYDVLRDPSIIKTAIKERAPFYVLPSTLALASSEMELAAETSREHILRRALKPIKKNYDYILIDCPPSLGLLTVNALTAAELLLVPVQTEFLSLNGLGMLTNTVKIVQQRLNPALKINGVICTLVDERRNLDNEVIASIEEHFSKKCLNTMIRRNVPVAEAPGHGKTIFEYAPSSTGAEDYTALCAEIMSLKRK